ncbi:MAG: glycosyltransferase family 4 protein [Spirochaetota bacterium]
MTPENLFAELLQSIHNNIQRNTQYEFQPYQLPPTPTKLKIVNSYRIKEILNESKETFITNAYRAIFHRDPSQQEQTHLLEVLAKGKQTQTYILTRLRYSKDGKKHNTSITGLLLGFLVSIPLQIPFLGAILRFFHSYYTLPKRTDTLQKEIRTLQNKLQAAESKLSNYMHAELHKLSYSQKISNNHNKVKIINLSPTKEVDLVEQPSQPEQKLKVILCCMSLQAGDAIGNDTYTQYSCLEPEHEVLLFSEYSDPKYQAKICKTDQLWQAITDNSAILIYHHSTFWELGHEILSKAQCKVILRYHNITPAEFFKNYDLFTYEQCQKGIKQTKELIDSRRISYILTTSQFNVAEVEKLGFTQKKKIKILAPFHQIDSFPPASLQKMETSKGKINILFVGRFVPNKGHLHILEVLEAYRNAYGSNIHATITGSIYPEFHSYLQEFTNRAHEKGLLDYIDINHHVPLATLQQLYQNADIFLLLSEHEGFCVPILEAQYYRVPIIAVKSSAIGETLGKQQVLFENFDSSAIASAIYTISQSSTYQKLLTEQGYQNYQLYSIQVLQRKFLSLLQQVHSD